MKATSKYLLSYNFAQTEDGKEMSDAILGEAPTSSACLIYSWEAARKRVDTHLKTVGALKACTRRFKTEFTARALTRCENLAIAHEHKRVVPAESDLLYSQIG